MKMKNVLLVVLSLVVVQAVNAATLKIFNAEPEHAIEATIVWDGGKKSTMIVANHEESLSSGFNPISGIVWKWHYPGATEYFVPLSLSTMSISHKIKILPSGRYQYDNGDSQMARKRGSGLEDDWTVIE